MLFSIRKYTESFQKGNSLIIYFLLKKEYLTHLTNFMQTILFISAHIS